MDSLIRPGDRVVAPVLATVVLLAAGCGGSNSSSSISSSSASQDAARLKFTQCMRDHGVDIPDTPGQNRGNFRNIDRSKLQGAQQACSKYRQAAFGTITPAQRQAFQDAFVKFSACMRQQGVEVPTPGGGTPGPPAGRRLDRNDPKTAAALKVCQSKLPNRGRFGGGPAGGGG